jgi:anti-sigma-K factor RskA
MTHAEMRELLGLHALGALEAEEAAALAKHLAGCRACREEVSELEQAAAGLAHAVAPLAPSPQVTRRILHTARAETSRAAVRSADRMTGDGGGGSHRRWRLLPFVAGLAMAAAVAGLVVSQFTLRARLDRALSMLARGRDLLEFIASPDVRTAALTSEYFPAARAFVAYDRASERLVFVAFDLPPPPPGQVYQLWAIGEAVRPAAVFSTDARGGAVIRDRWSAEPAQNPLFAISLEPSPGVPDPTGKILLMEAPRGRLQNGSRNTGW